MKNKAFKDMPIPERREKLRTVLCARTGCLLREEELDAIIRHTRLYKQYSILVYHNTRDMLESIAASASYKARFIVGSEAVKREGLEDQLAVADNENKAISMISKSSDSERRFIFIYIPRGRKEAFHSEHKTEKAVARL